MLVSKSCFQLSWICLVRYWGHVWLFIPILQSPYKACCKVLGYVLFLIYLSLFSPLINTVCSYVAARLCQSVAEGKGCLLTKPLPFNIVHVFFSKIDMTLIMKIAPWVCFKFVMSPEAVIAASIHWALLLSRMKGLIKMAGVRQRVTRLCPGCAYKPLDQPLLLEPWLIIVQSWRYMPGLFRLKLLWASCVHPGFSHLSLARCFSMSVSPGLLFVPSISCLEEVSCSTEESQAWWLALRGSTTPLKYSLLYLVIHFYTCPSGAEEEGSFGISSHSTNSDRLFPKKW